MVSRSGAAPGWEPSLWFAFLGPAAAWSVQLGVGWFLEEVVACAAATVERGTVLGIGLEAWLIGLTVVTGGTAAAAGAVGWRAWRRRRDPEEPRIERQAFMAFTGLLSAALFLPLILMGGLQVLALQPCRP
jgi:hypothetical protein